MKKRRMIVKDELGFSLIEVLVSMVIMAVGLLGLASLAGTTINVSSHARASTQAVHVGDGKLQSLLAIGYNDLHRSDDTAYVDLRRDCSLTDRSTARPVYTCIPATPTMTLDGREFTWHYTVTGIDMDGNGDADACRDRAKRVDVFVSWNDQLWHGRKEVQFSSLRGRGNSACMLDFGEGEDDCDDDDDGDDDHDGHDDDHDGHDDHAGDHDDHDGHDDDHDGHDDDDHDGHDDDHADHDDDHDGHDDDHDDHGDDDDHGHGHC